MITIDALIEQRKQLAATAANKSDRERSRKFVEWLTVLRKEVGGDVMVNELVTIAAAAWVDPVQYAQRVRGGVK